MLTHLTIKGLAIIDSLDIGFEKGFNVITGETGAGKSILIKALGLLLGTKAQADTVRKGADQAQVSGTFVVTADHPTFAYLKEAGIPVEAYESDARDVFDILIRRMVNDKGRSGAWINDVPVTVATLREFAGLLIDVFAQHETQRMLDSSMHTAYVDQFLKDRKVLLAYLDAYTGLASADRELRELIQDFRSKSRDADYISFRFKELEAFSPSKNDYDKVHSLADGARDASQIRRVLADAQVAIDGNDEVASAGSRLWDAAKSLREIADDNTELSELLADLEEVATKVDDASYRLGKSLSRFDVDEDTLEEAENRLGGYHELFRKFAVKDIDSLLSEHERLSTELRFLESASQEILVRLASMQKQANVAKKLAADLTTARLLAAKTVKKRIESELKELAMPDAIFDVKYGPHDRPLLALDLETFGDKATRLYGEVAETLIELSDDGAERAQFLFAPNKGEAAHPVNKIASGGEVSRIMLAFKKALATGADTCILVFDEIDTGISGRVADVVGRKMRSLADGFQVICISHLAQVAAYAEAHFRVQKEGKANRTESTIIRLSRKESVEEVARLLSGDEVTSSSLANAKALVAKAMAK